MASSLGFPGGECTRACGAAACPAGAVCTDLRSTSANAVICSAGCNADADCRSGYACCSAFTGGKACLPPSFCPSTNLGTSADLGAACTTGSCAAGETCGGGNPFPGGACTLPCAIGNQATCPSNGRCIDVDTGAFCLPTCNSPSDCRAGYDCVAISGVNGKVCRATGVSCTPGALATGTPPRACTPGDTPPMVTGNGGQPVGPPTAPQGCIKPVRCAALPAAQMQVFGTHTVNDVIQFNVPAGTAGVSILQQAVSANDTITYKGQVIDNSVVPLVVKQPGGSTLYDDLAPLPTGTDPLPDSLAFFGGGMPTVGAFTFPHTTKLLQQTATNGLASGTWSFTVNDYANECSSDPSCTFGISNSNRYDVQVLTRPGPLPANGAVDVNFYLVWAGDAATGALTATTAPTNPRVQRMVKTLSLIYGRAGICINKVTFFNVPAWAQTKFASGIDADKTGPCDNLAQMFTLSQDGNALNFFIVDAITSTSQGGTVVGIDGTIPGPSGVGGTVHSGAAVSGSDLGSGVCGTAGQIDLTCGADEVAYIAAHEGGHWFGLFHTSEATGDEFDTLNDTPICQCNSTCVGTTAAAKCGSAGGSSPTLVRASSCTSNSTSTTCRGADNLMFWQLDERYSLGNLSAQQGQVMRANPLTQ
jgi:hypothetical protein